MMKVVTPRAVTQSLLEWQRRQELIAKMELNEALPYIVKKSLK
jgi:hypothetical protein